MKTVAGWGGGNKERNSQKGTISRKSMVVGNTGCVIRASGGKVGQTAFEGHVIQGEEVPLDLAGNEEPLEIHFFKSHHFF